MKKIGIVGGVSWLATVDYYSELCRRTELAHAVQEISIESLDLGRAVSYLGEDGNEASWLRFDEYHRAALRRLEAGGAELAVIASNTPHHRFSAITRGIGIPVISVFDVVARECARISAAQVLILGTDLTMSSSVFRRAFADHGIEAEGPRSDRARDAITGLIAELQRGRPESAAGVLGSTAKASFEEQFAGRPVVCLACTELPLAFPLLKFLPVFQVDGVVYVNASAVHICAAFDSAR